MPLIAYMHIHTPSHHRLSSPSKLQMSTRATFNQVLDRSHLCSLPGPCTTSLFSLVVVVHVTYLHIRRLTHDYLGHSHSPTSFNMIIVLFLSSLSHRVIHHFRCCSRLFVSAIVTEPLLSLVFSYCLKVVLQIAQRYISIHTCDFQL